MKKRTKTQLKKLLPKSRDHFWDFLKDMTPERYRQILIEDGFSHKIDDLHIDDEDYVHPIIVGTTGSGMNTTILKTK